MASVVQAQTGLTTRTGFDSERVGIHRAALPHTTGAQAVIVGAGTVSSPLGNLPCQTGFSCVRLVWEVNGSQQARGSRRNDGCS